jgi:predicted regulator of Ras-like GTPase activity (Roadblock/LC7/MglB family)
VDAKQALVDLIEISSQIRSAVLTDESGDVLVSTFADQARAKEVADAALRLLAAAERTRPGLGSRTLTQFEVATLEGSVFVVRDHGRVLAATTSPEPTVGLVFYDLKSCLRSVAEGAEQKVGAKAKPPEPAADAEPPAPAAPPASEAPEHTGEPPPDDAPS